MTKLPGKKLFWVFLLLFLAANAAFLLYQSNQGWPIRNLLQSVPFLNRLLPQGSSYNDELNSFFERERQGGKPLFQYTNKPPVSPTPDVQGATTGQVLQATTTPSYLQYLPLPGAANFSSDLYNGAATIDYPIKLPPGPGGYTPSVSLNYSSNSIDEFMHEANTKTLHMFTRQSGSVGLGWSLGESSIAIDNHGEENPCFWTWKITFTGGAGEMFKTDASGNKVTKCEEVTDQYGNTTLQLTQVWKDGQWRTNPEMFLKIQEGTAAALFPGDPDFVNDRSIWKITTPDGSVYAFGHGSYEDGTILNESHPWVQPDGAWGGCDYTSLSWKLFMSQNTYGQRIKYSYAGVGQTFDAYVHPITGTVYTCTVRLRSRLTQMDYGANRITFTYGKARNDVNVVSEAVEVKTGLEGETYYYNGYYDTNDQYGVDSTALSSIDIYANGQLARKYNLSYYDTWQAVGSPDIFNWNCPTWKSRFETGGGHYLLNDNIPTYHLTLKSITEEVTPGQSFPPTSFTYQAAPYTVNVECNGTVAPYNLKNSIYLKSVNNGFGGLTEYSFDANRLSDRIYEANGINYVDNSNPSDGKMNKGLKRARLNKVKVYDGIASVNAGLGNFVESVFDYQNGEPMTVLTPDILNRAGGQIFDSDFAGYPTVTAYSGKKNLTISTGNPVTWSSKSKSFFHQSLSASGCYQKDPRSGNTWRSQSFDENGLIAESAAYIRFRNVADIASAWPDLNGESCTNIPARPLELTLRTDSFTANSGVAVTSLLDVCKSAAPAAYCNYSTTVKNTYDWNFSLTNNPETGKFGGLLTAENFVNQLSGSTLTPNRVGVSQTRYLHQGYGIGNTATYLLNKPYESWIAHPTNAADTTKYKWQYVYYDYQTPGGASTLQATGKGLPTRTESRQNSGAVAGKNEVVANDSWGNITQVRDGNGNTTTSAYDTTFHAYVISVTNALNQNSSVTYNTTLGVPLTTTDLNGKTTTLQYDGLGRLTKVLKSGDTAPSTEFSYTYNQPATHGVPMAVLTKVRTEQNTADANKILQTYDLYDGLGSQIQSQSLIADRVHTTWADQDTTSKTIVGIQNFAFDTYTWIPDATNPFGKLRRDFLPGTRVSYTKTNLSGNFVRSQDFNGNTNFVSTDVQAATSKTVAASGSMSVTVANPISRVTTSKACKDLRQVDETTFFNERFNYDCLVGGNEITSTTTADFLGNVVSTKDTAGTTITSSTYDELGRLLTSNNVDVGQSRIEGYDSNGNILKTVDAANVVFESTYDALNRPVEKKVNGVVKNKYFYDQNYDTKDCGTTPKGKLCKREATDNFDNPIKNYFTYNNLNQLVSLRQNFGGTLADQFGTSDFVTNYTHDNVDRVKTITYPTFANSGVPVETVTYNYTGPFLKSVTGDQTYVSDITYDELGRLTNRKLGNNLNESYAYDTQHRLDSLFVSGASSVPLSLYYDYENTTGNITSITDTNFADPFTNRSASYDYDSLSRLTQVIDQSVSPPVVHTYGYDDRNNLTSKTEGGRTYSFGVNNNFPYHGVKSINGSDPVLYDSLGQIRSYTVPDEYGISVQAYDATTGKPQRIQYSPIFPEPSASPGASPVPSTVPQPSASPAPTDVIFADGFESGDTSAWSAESDGENDLNVTTTAALAGSQGLAALINNTTSMYVRSDHPNAESRYRARFYLDPNSVTMASGDIHQILQGRNAAGTTLFNVQFNYSTTVTPASHRIRLQIYNDAGTVTNSAYYTITDAPHSIEVDWQAATAAGANNGSLTLWIDGVQKEVVSAIDNDTHRVDEARFGPLSGVDATTIGTYYIDAFESRKTTYIGQIDGNSIAQTLNETEVLGASDPATEMYYYDADGSRIMKAAVDGFGRQSNHVLYVNQYLEKDNQHGIIRKNYFAGGKLVAVRVFELPPPPPQPSPTPEILPSPDIPGPLGDANNDGLVTEADYDIMQPNYMATISGGSSVGDFNTDSVVNYLDYAIWYTTYTQPTPLPGASASPGASPVTATPVPSASPTGDIIFSDGFESGNTSAWSSETDGENDLTVTTAAKLVGNNGLSALIDNNTAMYVRSDHPNAEPHYRARFRFDPNSIAMVSGNVHTILRGRTGSGGSVFDVEFNNNTGTSAGYRIRTKIWNDANSSTTGTYYAITDAPHHIEIEWKAATAAGANNGTVTLWIDGVQKYTSPGIDNDTHRVEEAQLGPLSGIDSGTRGTYFLDAFESRRSTYIGP